MQRSNQVLTGAMLGWLAFVLIGATIAQNPADSPFSELAAPAAKTADAPQEFCECVGESDLGAVRKIERALRGPLHSQGLDFTQIPLDEVISTMQDEYGIPIQLDRTGLDEIGVNADEPVTISLSNISLRSALRLMLKTSNLTYVIENEVLIITTPQAAEQNLKVCVYDIGGIAGKESTPGNESRLGDAITMCRRCRDRHTWAENGGGEAEIRPDQAGACS